MVTTMKTKSALSYFGSDSEVAAVRAIRKQLTPGA